MEAVLTITQISRYSSPSAKMLSPLLEEPECKDEFNGFGDELHVVAISSDNEMASFAGFIPRVDDGGEPKHGIKAMLQRRGLGHGYGMMLLCITLVLLVLSIVGFLAMSKFNHRPHFVLDEFVVLMLSSSHNRNSGGQLEA